MHVAASRPSADYRPARHHPGNYDPASYRSADNYSARHHLAVIAGPDCGLVLPLLAGGAVIGRGPEVDLMLADHFLSRRHLQARERNAIVRIRDLRSANGTRLRLARGRAERVSRRTRGLGRRWRPLPAGSRIVAGATVLELRRHPAMVHSAAEDESDSIGEGLMGRLMLPLIMSVTTLPLLLRGGGAWRVALMVAIPVALLVAILWPALKQRARRLRRAAKGDSEPVRTRVGQPWADPAALLAGIGAPVELPEDGVLWEIGDANGYAPRPRRLGVPPRGRKAARAERMRWTYPPAPGTAVALVGGAETVAALGRWIAVRHAVTTGERLRTPWPGLTALSEQSEAGSAPATAPPAATHARSAPAGTSAGNGAATGSDPPVLWVWYAGGDENGSEPHGELKRHGERYRHLVLAEQMKDLPRWCGTVIDVRAGHNRNVQTSWTRAVVAALPPSEEDAAPLPEQVHLAELLPKDLTAWAEPSTYAPLGVGSAGPLWLDLAEHGPHALVAGTTGAGKSELLLAWIMGLAHHAGPADMSFVLFDYKGGATFSPLADLEHVVGVLTDLDESTTARALRSLQAELRSREHALAAVGAHNIEEQRRRTRGPERLGRLVVVVDEFRVMADTHPEQLDALVRLAAQGRSLGIHLILATQRPGGAITPDMRANLTLRLCLRVLEETDSMDMLGDASASRLPRIPGRAIVRSEAALPVQTPWCGPAAQGWIRRRVCDLNAGAESLARAEPWRRRRHRPWAPPLPEVCWAEDLLEQAEGLAPEAAEDPGPEATDGPGPGRWYDLPWAQVDLPDQQRLAPWWPAGGTLLVTGGPGSGRTTALQSLALSALRAGTLVHVLAEGAGNWPGKGAPSAGTWCPTDDPRRAHRLLQLLLSSASPALLLVDDADAVAECLDEVGTLGDGADLLLAVLRRSRRLGLDIALTADERSRRWAGAAGRQMLLCPRDPADAVMAGAPRDLVSTGWPAGRGVLLERGTAQVAQVALVRPEPQGWREPGSVPLRLAALPDDVVLAEGPLGGDAREGGALPAQPGRLVLGRGGDAAQWVHRVLRSGSTWLVCGPVGSGRSTALATMQFQLREQGWDVVCAADLPQDEQEPGNEAQEPAERGPGTAEHRRVLIVDDADRLRSSMADACTAYLSAAAEIAVVAAARSEGLMTAYSPLASRLRDADMTIVLAETRPAHLPGVDLRALQDPMPCPGRGVLIDPRDSVPLQLARSDTAPPSAQLLQDAVGPTAGAGSSQ